jgi:hypothetical protein
MWQSCGYIRCKLVMMSMRLSGFWIRSPLNSRSTAINAKFLSLPSPMDNRRPVRLQRRFAEKVRFAVADATGTIMNASTSGMQLHFRELALYTLCKAYMHH